MRSSPVIPEPESSPEAHRARIVDNAILGIAIALIPVAAFGVYSEVTQGRDLLREEHLLGCVLAWVIAIRRDIFSQPVRVWIILLVLLLTAVAEYHRSGLATPPVFLMAVIPIFVTAGLGPRHGFATIALIAALFAGVAWLSRPEGIHPAVFFPVSGARDWAVFIANYLIAVTGAVLVTGHLLRFYEWSYRALRRQNAELVNNQSRGAQAAKLGRLGYASTDEGLGRIVDCDETFAAMHGLTVKQMLDASIASDIIDGLVHEDDRAAAKANVTQMLKGETLTSEFRHVMPDGETRYLRKIFTPKIGGDAHGAQFEVVAQDVTEAHLLNEHVQQSQKMEAIGNLTGGIAHDFNNLLAIVLGNLELLEDALDEEKVNRDDMRRSVETATKAAMRGAELTQSMLAFARRAPLEPSEVDLNELVGNAGTWMGRTLPSIISLKTSLMDGLRWIRVDRVALETALLNLIVNARDVMPDGGKLTVETANVLIDDTYIHARHEDIEPGHYVLLAVSDTGAGVAPAIIDRIFDPFFTTKPVGKGSGLGLAMIQGFVKQSGGAVRVYSEAGVGTTFKLYFPAIVGTGTATKPPERLADGAARKGLRILVAEDEPDVLNVVVAVLGRAGYDVVPAHSGDEAKAIFDADPGFDLLLTDIVMPGLLQGTTLSKVLREIEPALPVVFMSGYASEATVHGNGLRPTDIRLMKPVRRVDLLAAIERALAQAET